jgi:hypothetical protein
MSHEAMTKAAELGNDYPIALVRAVIAENAPHVTPDDRHALAAVIVVELRHAGLLLS